MAALRDHLVRYWLTFEPDETSSAAYRLGVGVTGTSVEEALELVRDSVFDGGALPPVASVVGHVDLQTLDADHVLPNTGDPTLRGVWFPRP